jgi:hypothetical protein
VLRGSGLSTKSSLKSIVGFSDTETVKLDFDHTSLETVKYWAKRVMDWFNLEGFIVLKSSEDCSHVVFNRLVSWSENMHIVAWTSLLSRNAMLEKWFLMQCIKESSTLRVSPKREKPSPRIVYSHGKLDQQIKGFLSHRKSIKSILKRMRGVYCNG